MQCVSGLSAAHSVRGSSPALVSQLTLAVTPEELRGINAHLLCDTAAAVVRQHIRFYEALKGHGDALPWICLDYHSDAS
jgi:hypothetical protein